MPLIMEGKESSGGMKIPPGVYEVTCMNVVADTLKLQDGSTSDVIRFDMETEDVYDEEGNPAQMDAIASAKLTPRSKLTSWVTAFGLPFEIGRSIDIEQCITRKAQVKVVKKLDKNGQESGFTKVDDIMPLGRRAENKAIEDMTVQEWWPFIRGNGISTKEATDKAVELFGKEPKDITGEQRKAVWEAF